MAEMKLRHAAVLVLVVWYLLMPPLRHDGTVSSFAPLTEWEKSGTYDTFDECKRALKGLSGGPTREEAATCVASNDPRLKG
jgi:hypothetical protein